jgi:outer membrane immunogenic protein
MKKLLRTGVAFAALIAGPAMGADLARPVYRVPRPVAVVVYNWTGFYVGVNAGYAWSRDNSVNSVGSLLFSSPLAAPAATAAAVAGVTTSIPGSNANGFIGGGQVGYNYQFNNFVVGIEADIQGLSGRSSGTTASSIPITGFAAFANTTLTATNSVHWLGTLRGQLGFTITPSLLVYGTGGLAYGEVESSTTIGQQLTAAAGQASGPYGSVAGISQTRIGWAAGAGAAWMITSNWNTKLEYLHYDLGSVSYSGVMSNLAIAGGGIPVGTVFYTVGATSSTSFRGDIIRVGLNYKFGYAPAPAVYK